MTWNEAKEYCISQGSNLVTFNNSTINDELKLLCQLNYDTSNSGGCWNGLYHNDSTSLWKWSDGSSLNYGFNIDGSPTVGIYPWSQGEPNNVGGNENCVHGILPTL